MKWISVDAHLPTKKQAKMEDKFLVVIEKQPKFFNRPPWRSVELAEFFPEQERDLECDFPGSYPYWELDGYQRGEFKITHWMIIPKLPQRRLP